ncbi:ribonucleoside-diphosphate reductase small subunit M2 [Bodo saltans virus]|uniref:Ribonucleoside-diphosphate reductase small chain n=1 Tax=Bodo saltans virus TaxID=2024608 RepID=A0A2H4UV40_9VIRU|nr:ribonucleoside-diphosphate reductase small subunit M2 [Bodo saltans virus]ATZ80792.1 ribonucleoside-diphosphate reductase small subunit M2 [Bodo saltans virus]
MSEYEVITDPANTRFFVKPINPLYEQEWKLYKKMQELYWTAEEIKYTSSDIDHFESLKKEEQQFLKMVLAFFASSDGIVNYNLRERFLQEFTPIEIQTAYGFQLMMESIHGEVYSDLIINIVKDPTERNLLLNAVKEIPAVKKMSDWAITWIHSKESIGVRLIAFAIVEGVFFSGMFASIFWLKKQRANGTLFLEAIVKSNRFISRDEGLHYLFACMLFKHIRNKPTQDVVHAMVKEANEISSEFMTESIQCEMIGMNRELMKQYINYISDMLLHMLGYDKLYNAINPFDFMDTITLMSKDNFFENRPDAYQKAHNDENKNEWDFEILEKF